jgi:hypothetical protein
MKAQSTETKPPQINQVEMSEEDIAFAERIAQRLGYEQTAYTSTSGLWGLFCLNENPRTWKGNPQALKRGCVIKTVEFGFLFVSDVEDLGLHDLYAELVRKGVGA